MKHRVLTTLVLVGLAALNLATTHYQPNGMVNDFANILPPETREGLEQQLRGYEEQTTIEIAVVTIPSLEGIPVEEYANKLFRAWGIGKKNKDNGILFLVAPTDRKMRIEVGYGMEPDLTDLQAGAIITTFVLPQFKQGKMAEGITAGVNSIINTLGGKPFQQREEERVAAAAEQRRQSELAKEQLKAVMLVIGVLIVGGGMLAVVAYLFLSAIRRRREYRAALKTNKDTLADLAKVMDQYEPEVAQALRRVENIKHQHTSNAWSDLVLAQSADTLRDKIAFYKNSRKPASIKEAWEVTRKIAKLRDQVGEYTRFPEMVARRSNKLNQAVEESRPLKKKAGELLVDLESSLRHTDVRDETKEMGKKAREIFESTRGMMDLPKWDYLAIYEQLNAAMAVIALAQQHITRDKEYAAKAREEGPKLFLSIPELMEKAEKEVPAIDLNPIKKRFEKAQLSFSGARVNWTVAFTEISAIIALIQAAINQVRAKKSEEERRQRRRREESSSSHSSSSYDYGSSSSSSSGGSSSFGGGDSGGGGASGSW